MSDLIHRLATWVALLLKPRSSPPAPPQPTLAARPVRPTAAPLPAPRSPYGLDTPLDATATRSVRPYLTAHEQGPYWIHGLEVA
ncbi:hypothetical protein [Streptomyces sp. V4I2]|uniref:hypothetical protein n=1 Tax=Streptomyces sp. V4I2 TaxID=3042280 RepID=UPI00277E049B|nr:hypothetical protein [Streptomyces sp. V4I2]MDQ1046899.1 hypothetical protein [Streptomyces sp. V4I2]